MEKLKSTMIHHSVRRKFALTVDEYCLADSICRMSTGPNWPWCKKDKNEIGKDLDMSGRTVYRKLEKLVKKGLIEMSIEGLRATDLWRNNAEIDNVAKKNDKVAKEIDTLARPTIYKESIKESIKVQSAVNGSDVNDIIALFKDINPTGYSKFFSRPPQRKAVERLLVKFPRPQLDAIVKVLIRTNAIRYAPSIHSPLELEDKIAKLESFIKKKEDSGGGITIL